MFHSELYAARRHALAARMSGGLLLFAGNDEAPTNFRANVYPFVQDGCFAYFFGIVRPGLAGVIDVDAGTSWLFGDDAGIDAAIWMGAAPRIAEQAMTIGAAHGGTLADLVQLLSRAREQARAIVYPPVYSDATLIKISAWLDQPLSRIRDHRATELIRTIVALREIKGPEEVSEIEQALSVTAGMHHAAMAATRPGVAEHDVIGHVMRVANGADRAMAYQPIFTARGEILHNLSYSATLRTGDLVVHDSGAVSPLGYASDITRTLPVSGRFTPVQRRLYDAVLKAQTSAIDGAKPDIPFRDLHVAAAGILVEELADLGLFKGDPADIVASGAYAICFPCGLGHQLGLDVHDMEALGEDDVGYDDEVRRSALFGLKSLRLGKRLRPGMVVTVEPGLYFIPQLIDLWRSEGRHADYIDYDRADAFRRFGGIRIEDDVLITDTGCRILGPAIPRSADAVEAAMGQGT